MGCLFAPIAFLKWAFTSGWKGIVVLLVLIVVILVGFFVIRNYVNDTTAASTKPPVTSTVQAAGLPSKKVAPYQVTTWSRTYYAVKAVKNKDGTVTMTDYWELLKGKWIENKSTFTLDKNFGTLTVKKR